MFALFSPIFLGWKVNSANLFSIFECVVAVTQFNFQTSFIHTHSVHGKEERDIEDDKMTKDLPFVWVSDPQSRWQRRKCSSKRFKGHLFKIEWQPFYEQEQDGRTENKARTHSSKKRLEFKLWFVLIWNYRYKTELGDLVWKVKTFQTEQDKHCSQINLTEKSMKRKKEKCCFVFAIGYVDGTRGLL